MKTITLNSPKDFNSLEQNSIVDSFNPELLRKAVERKKVLINPLYAKAFYRDDGLVRSIAESESSFALPVEALLHSRGSGRAKLFRELRFFTRLCRKLGAKFFFTNLSPKSKFDLKSEREIQAIATLLGLTPQQAKSGKVKF